MPKRLVKSGSEIGPYSAAVVAGNHCYVAGTGGFVPETGELAPGIEGEIRQTMENLRATLARAGFELGDVVSTTCYLREMSDWPLLNKIYADYLGGEPPARAAVVVSDMPAGAKVEITAIAWRGEGPKAGGDE